jgi:K+-transporting ATPase KdpF subunit
LRNARPLGKDPSMSEHILGLIVAALVAAYLVYALLRPERF